MGGFALAKNSKATAEKVSAYASGVDLDKLSKAERAEAIRKLADKINSLPADERRKLRMQSRSPLWFEKMTEEEKGVFIEATMPGGLKQMLSAFEELPPDRRKRAIQDAVKRMREAREDMSREDPAQAERAFPANQAFLSEELQQKAINSGLKTFYSQSSAKTKAEVAPLLEELQNSMESGRMMNRGPR